MIRQCLTKQTKSSKKYKDLQKKYNTDEDSLNNAIYSWAGKEENSDEVSRNGIDISNNSLEEYLDEYFKVKGSIYYTKEEDLNKAVKIYDYLNKNIIFSTLIDAINAYNKCVDYFGEDTVIMHSTIDGKYIVRVLKPTMKNKPNSREEAHGEKPSKKSSKSALEKSYDKLMSLKKMFSDRIKLDEKTHTYFLYKNAEDKRNNKDGRPITSVSTYIYGKREEIPGWGIPSSTLGNTNDAVFRDYFSNNLKKSYPNLTKTQLNNLVEDLKLLESYFKKLYGEDCKIITEEFPILGTYTVSKNGNYVTEYLAGTMDMIIIDKEGKYHIYDMKAKRSGLRLEDKINYGNQMGLYSNILEPYGVHVEDTHVILSDAGEYATPIQLEGGAVLYEVDESSPSPRQLYANGVKIQNSKQYGYTGIRLHLSSSGTINNRTLVPLNLDKNNERMAIEFEALSEEDKALAEEDTYIPVSKETIDAGSSIKYGDRKTGSSKSRLYNPALPAEQRKFLADQVMYTLSYIVTQLQTSEEAHNGEDGYFPGEFPTSDFTSMTRQEIIKTIGIQKLFNKVEEKFNERLDSIEDEDTFNRLLIAFDNFRDLINEGYAKLISLESVSIANIAEDEKVIQDTGNDDTVDNNDSAALEEKEREYWQLGQRNISAKSSLSSEIRRLFERLEVLDKNGKHVQDKYGFGFNTYVDSDSAVANILEWCSNCTTIEEMEEILKVKSESNPYLNTILEKIKEEPIRSLFFKNFRKDFTQYSIVTAERDDSGKMNYTVTTINTRGATSTILKNLTATFATGNIQGLILTKDEIEGRGKVNVENVEKLKEMRASILSRLKSSKGNRKTYAKVLKEESRNIAVLLNKLGVMVTPETVEATISSDSDKTNSKAIRILDKAGFIIDTLLKNKNRRDYNPMLKGADGNVYSDYREMINILSDNIERSIESSTYENGKMYYSFVTPSYMGSLITNLKNAIGNKDKFKKYIQDNYKDYRWFYEPDYKMAEEDRWNNTWLQLISGSKEIRDALDHKVQLSFGKTPYNELSELGYTLSLMQEYFYDKSKRWAWYRLPILSNKPSSEFIKFVRFSGYDYKQNIKHGLKKTFNQEILRIKTVLERAALSDKTGVSKIANYDINIGLLKKAIGDKEANNILFRIKNKSTTAKDLTTIMRAMATKGGHSGAEFRFLDAINDEIKNNSEIGKLIVDKINGKTINEASLDELLVGRNNGKSKGAFDNYMDKVVKHELEQWKSIGLFDTTVTEKKGKKFESYKYLSQLGKTEEEVVNNLTEYIWNDMFATINLIQITATDLAYYKNMEDFQKRYAQVHSPTLKLNTSAEYKGVRVSTDGNSRTIYIKDNEIKSEIIDNVSVIFDRKIASITDPKERSNMKKMRDLIISSFEKELNVTDAQGYSSPTSYRKKMIMAGTWDDTMEKAYKRIASGNYNINDLGVVWQPLKPFVYSQIKKTTGVDTMSEIRVPVQNKNSEYMLLLADAIMRGGKKKNTLSAIFDFMENSARDGRDVKNGKPGVYNGIGIDTVQFESAVKSGLMGVIDINDKSYDEIIDTLEGAVYYNEDHSPSEDNNNDRYNDQYVHTIPYSDYGIQQEVPDHLMDHFQGMGSQVRILSISDINEEAKFKVYGEEKEWDGKHLIDKYQELTAKNIRESFDKLIKELKITDSNGRIIRDRKLRNKALSEILVDAINKDQRYGNDLLRACKLDENDEFVIPLNDPIQSRRIQQLINSIIKSRINKQKVKGGPVVQVTSYGTSDDLHIVFNDKEGNPLRSKGEKESDEEYRKYLEKNQASLSHMEIYITVPSKELEELLTDKDGSLMEVDEALRKGIITDEMLKSILYRIPTEDKYSMIPAKIKGFLPRAAGEAVMMPKEITLLTGSDFDKHQC